MNTVCENIKKRADREFGGDFARAATAYFQDHPDHYVRPAAARDVRAEDPDQLNRTFKSQMDRIALRDGLKLDKPDDRLQAIQKVAAELPDLYHRVTKASTVKIGKAHL